MNGGAGLDAEGAPRAPTGGRGAAGLAPSAVVAGYRLLAPLGEGGEGAVFLAEATDGLGKQVALKVFAPADRGRFERELEAYRRLEAVRRERGASLLVEGLAAGPLPDGGGFLALGYQAGGTLADRVRASGPLPAPEAARVALALLRGLALLHGAGLCHRDVKPSNVLLGADGAVRLGDFGLARGRDATVSTGGTPAFAAPEQLAVDDRPAARAADDAGGPPARGTPARDGVAIDVYGAGATLHYLLTGRSPPPGRPDVFALEAAQVPRALQRALVTALAHEPARRHADAVAFARALEEALAERDPAAHGADLAPAAQGGPTDPPRSAGGPDARTPGRPGPGFPLAAALLAAAALGGLAWRGLLGGGRPEAGHPPTASTADRDAPPAAGTAGPVDTPTTPPSARGPDAPASDRPRERTGEAPGPAVREDARVGETTPLPDAGGRSDEGGPGHHGSNDGRSGDDGSNDDGSNDGGPGGGGSGGGGLLSALVRAADGSAVRVALPAPAVARCALPDGRVVVGTTDGDVLLVDAAGAPPARLHRFAYGVLRLALAADGALEAEGDDRAPRPLGPGEVARPDEREVEGALGRWAVPRAPVVVRVRLSLAPREVAPRAQ